MRQWCHPQYRQPPLPYRHQTSFSGPRPLPCQG